MNNYIPDPDQILEEKGSHFEPTINMIRNVMNMLEDAETDKDLTDEEIDHIAKLDAVDDFEPCEVSEEICDFLTNFHERMHETVRRAAVECMDDKVRVEMSRAEYEMIEEKACEIGMDVPNYMKFIALNTKVDLTTRVDEIKSAYSYYYPDQPMLRWAEMTSDTETAWTASNAKYVFWIKAIRGTGSEPHYSLSQWEWYKGGTRHAPRDDVTFDSLDIAKANAELWAVA